MDGQKISELKAFVASCKSDPSILHHPSLSFFRDYLQSLGAQIPPQPMSKDPVKGENDDDMIHQKFEKSDSEDEIMESDIELDGELVEPDYDPPQKMGDQSIEVSEENRDAAQMCKAKAMDAISECKLDEAINYLTEAILLNPSSAILYATRASVFVKLSKPNAAIRDADVALQINSDSAKGYKYRGMAKAMLGLWEGAASDLHVASKLDYDEEINSVLKKVEPNAHKIGEHRRKYERLRKERQTHKVERQRQRQNAESKPAYGKEKKESSSDAETKDSDFLAALQDGSVISVHSSNELQTKIRAATHLHRLLILYFTATWCGPCRFMAPIYKSLAEKHREVVFLKVDIDVLPGDAHHWNVSSMPTFFIMRDGKEIDKVVGADKSGLEAKIAMHAGKS